MLKRYLELGRGDLGGVGILIVAPLLCPLQLSYAGKTCQNNQKCANRPQWPVGVLNAPWSAGMPWVWHTWWACWSYCSTPADDEGGNIANTLGTYVFLQWPGDVQHAVPRPTHLAPQFWQNRCLENHHAVPVPISILGDFLNLRLGCRGDGGTCGCLDIAVCALSYVLASWLQGLFSQAQHQCQTSACRS